MKQFLLFLDDRKELGQSFVLEDLDDTHLFIDASFLDKLREKVNDLMDKHSYDPDKVGVNH